MMVNEKDRQHNELLLARAHTDFHAGETLVLDGVFQVRITEVLPKGTVIASAAKGWLPQSTNYGPVVCAADVYRYAGVSLHAAASGQTTARHLCRPRAARLCAA